MSQAARVLLVGYQDQDNLGIRYLASSLQAEGHATRIETFGEDPAPLLRLIRAWAPDVVGFSLIFQFMAESFAGVIHALREAGVQAHFTMGGHYPSFAPETILELTPGLDSVVRFEGELTLCDLAGRLARGQEWRTLEGIAFRDDDGRVVTTGPRTKSIELDALPWPDRDDIDYRRQRIPTASVLASRGCPWTCSFCSIITFYEANGTRGRRRRSPLLVVDEVEDLVRRRGARIILFQDDDFLAGGRVATRWAHELAAELIRRGLHHEQRFKISCRSDEIRDEVIEPLIAAGLAHVYMGVEAGDPVSLMHFAKRITPDVHLRAGEILRRFGLSFDFGFMLLEPWSKLASVKQNLAFLRQFSADGHTTAGFCRTLPYVGTPIEQRLRSEGRLTGPALEADYAFLDPRLDVLWDFALAAFEGRNYGHGATSTWDVLRSLLFEARLDMPDHPRDPGLLELARALADASNQILLDVTEQAIELVEEVPNIAASHPDLIALARLARREDSALRVQITGLARSLSARWRESGCSPALW